MSGWLRMVLAIQVVFFALWGGRLLTSHRDVATVWLATEPVDPRDLLSGHYVALQYRIAAPEHTGCALPIAAGAVYLQLAPIAEPLSTGAGEIQLWEPVACRLGRPVPGADEVWLAGRIEATQGRTRLLYGIERMYVGERNPLRDARSGSVVAEVAINDAFEPRLVGLVSTRQPGPAPQ
jgi:hypothetical protein